MAELTVTDTRKPCAPVSGPGYLYISLISGLVGFIVGTLIAGMP